MARLLWPGFVICSFLAGLGLGIFLDGGPETAQARPACRPSHPHLMDPAPTVLFWGNSLAFDHGWRIAGHRSVNCALQGLTAERAAELTPALPEMELAAIVLVFGTVELLRGLDDPKPFRQGVAAVLETLRQRHPETRIIALAIPEGAAWRYARLPLLEPLNAVLGGLEGVDLVDTSRVLSAVPAPQRSYDGVHLTAESYAALEAALSALLDGTRR